MHLTKEYDITRNKLDNVSKRLNDEMTLHLGGKVKL